MLRGSRAGVLGRSGASRVGARRGAARRSAGRLRVAGGGGVPRSPVLCGSHHTVRRGRRAGVRREGCSGVGLGSGRHGMVPAAVRGPVVGPACRVCVVSASEATGGPGLASRSGRAQQLLLRHGRVSRIACACVACLADELARMHAWVASLCLCLLACCVCSCVASLYVVFVWCSKLEN